MATIRDVARAAQVSIATVSRALNGSARVSEETRRRVGAAADALNYWPNGAARSLSTRRTHALGVLLPDLHGEFFSEVIRGLDHAARERGFQTLISSSHAEKDTVLAAARSMQGRIDGLAIMTADAGLGGVLPRIRQRFPVVLLNPHRSVAGCSAVSVANFDGASAATRHLLDLGHRRIAMLAGPAGNVDADERLRGYHAALREAGVARSPALVFRGSFTEASGYGMAEELVGRRPLPSAVFAANDSMAVGLVSALGLHGLRVPRDVAVVGFDDIAIARYLSPPLTTVHVDAYGLGARAVRLLIAAVTEGGPAAAVHEVLPAPLVVRASCGSRRDILTRARTRSQPADSIQAGGPES